MIEDLWFIPPWASGLILLLRNCKSPPRVIANGLPLKHLRIVAQTFFAKKKTATDAINVIDVDGVFVL